MKNRSIKMTLQLFILVGMMFISSKVVHASEILNQSLVDASANTATNEHWATSTNFSNSFSALGAVTFFVKTTSSWFIDHNDSCSVSASANGYNATNSVLVKTLVANTVTPLTFYFASSSTINFDSENLSDINVAYYGSNCNTTNGAVQFGYSNTDTVDGAYYVDGALGAQLTKDLAFILYDQNGIPLGEGSTIKFDPGNFHDPMDTFDFQFWDLIASTTITGDYDLQVNWGTSTPSGYTNKWTDDYPRFHMQAGQEYHVPMLKSPTSTPGSYQAEAFLFSWNGSSYDLIANSNVIHITIAAGDLIEHNPYWYTEQLDPCPDTSFSVLGADFGRGICKVARFLFVPFDLSKDIFTASYNKLFTKFPYNGLEGIRSAFEDGNVASTTAPLIISISGTGTIATLNINVASTSKQFIGTESFNLIYYLCGVGIWITVAIYFFFRLKGLF